MSNSGYKMQFGTVETAGTDIGSAANNLETKLNDMDTALKPLQADWTGEASEAYVQAKIQWTKAISEMKVLLADIGRQVIQDANDAQSNEGRNKSRW
ncbi:WXG100 family type VII secretion target [Microbacterium alcoholitolerans]|uniref:WXG100 family type VII secretion target n=1 Tax=unclassified Microbacterium TaxID=2609290 RepID=UPI003D17D0C9